MLFPNDARNNTIIAKAVAGFGLGVIGMIPPITLVWFARFI